MEGGGELERGRRVVEGEERAKRLAADCGARVLFTSPNLAATYEKCCPPEVVSLGSNRKEKPRFCFETDSGIY